MKLQQLQYFAAVYEQGSFSAAANKANATQSGLSMHVSQIEKRYNVVLFERSSSGVTPTEAGRSFYKEAVKVLAATRNAEERLRSLSKAVVGHVHVGLMPTFTRAVLTAALMRFAKEYPEVRLSISESYSGTLLEEVKEGRLDFGVVPAFVDLDEVLVSKRMGMDKECLVCSSDRELTRTKDGVMLDQISPLRLVLPGAGNARRRRIENYLTANQINVSDLMELDTMHGTLDLVANSEWVTILPGIMCLPDLESGPRQVAPLANPPLMVDYMRIETRKRPLHPAAQAFADVLQEELNSALEIDPFSQH